MPSFAPLSEAVLDRLKAIVGAGGWKPSAEAHRYLEDPRGNYEGRARLILLPGATEEVSRIVRLCNETGTGLIPYGGGTGVVAGQLSTESDDAVILSLERMNRVREINAEDFAMVAEAGCILENVHAAAAEHGLMFPLGMASKGSCTIGGNLATNAGGIQVLRHGNARDLCLGIEAVLPSGAVLDELAPLRKNNTGYDLRHLLIGSEGTLGVITAASLVLKPIDAEHVTALCAIASPAEGIRLFAALRQRLGEALTGLELLSGFGIGLVTAHFPKLKYPFAGPYPWFLLAEIDGAEGMRERAEIALADCLEHELLADVVIAQSEAQRANLWDLREHTPEANKLTGAICNSDTSVPISQLNRFIAETHAAITALYPGLRTNSYGHIGDGNIHHNVFAPEGCAKSDFLAAHPGMMAAVREAIDEVTVRCGGSISAEHGIGRLKRDDLRKYGSAAKLEAIRQIKAALDPNGIMNPGALIG